MRSLSNKFFFFEPFHLKVYIKAIERIQVSLQRENRKINIFLYRPLDSTVKYIDSLNYFKKIDSSYCFLPDDKEKRAYQMCVYENVD